jgi:hypothetical protein
MEIIKHKNKYYIKSETGYKEILATTDNSLLNTIYTPHISGEISKRMLNLFKLPQPSQQFIEKYIECYNKGEVITDVLVEYENNYDLNYYTPPGGIECCEKIDNWKLKVNPKDNTITIKKLKDSWSRNELEEIVRKAFKAGVNKGIALEIYKTELDNNPKADKNFDKIPTENKWIEENL